MEERMNTAVNQVALRDSVVGSAKGEGWAMLEVATSPPEGKRDRVRVFFYSALCEKAQRYRLKSHVQIDAAVITSRAYRNETIQGLAIRRAPSEVEEKFGRICPGRSARDINEVRLSGPLVHKFMPAGDEVFLIGHVQSRKGRIFRGSHEQSIVCHTLEKSETGTSVDDQDHESIRPGFSGSL